MFNQISNRNQKKKFQDQEKKTNNQSTILKIIKMSAIVIRIG